MTVSSQSYLGHRDKAYCFPLTNGLILFSILVEMERINSEKKQEKISEKILPSHFKTNWLPCSTNFHLLAGSGRWLTVRYFRCRHFFSDDVTEYPSPLYLYLFFIRCLLLFKQNLKILFRIVIEDFKSIFNLCLDDKFYDV